MTDINIENFWDDKKRTADALEEIAGIEKNTTNIRYDDDKRIARAVEKIQKEGGIPSGGGSQADWNENDSTSPAYILNKPFGIPTEEVILENGTVNITYDDDYEEYVVSSISIETPLMAGETYIFTIDGVDYTSTGIARENIGDIAFENVIGVGTSIKYDEGRIQFPCFYSATEVGTHSVTITHITRSKIDRKYIPDKIYDAHPGKLLAIGETGVAVPVSINDINIHLRYTIQGNTLIGNIKTYSDIINALNDGKNVSVDVRADMNSIVFYCLPLVCEDGGNNQLIFESVTSVITNDTFTGLNAKKLIIDSSSTLTYTDKTVTF